MEDRYGFLNQLVVYEQRHYLTEKERALLLLFFQNRWIKLKRRNLLVGKYMKTVYKVLESTHFFPSSLCLQTSPSSTCKQIFYPWIGGSRSYFGAIVDRRCANAIVFRWTQMTILRIKSVIKWKKFRKTIFNGRTWVSNNKCLNNAFSAGSNCSFGSFLTSISPSIGIGNFRIRQTQTQTQCQLAKYSEFYRFHHYWCH